MIDNIRLYEFYMRASLLWGIFVSINIAVCFTKCLGKGAFAAFQTE